MFIVHTDQGYYLDTIVERNEEAGTAQLVDRFIPVQEQAKLFWTAWNAETIANQLTHLTNVRVEYVKELLPKKKTYGTEAKN